MPLPIPDILENASNVITAARTLCQDQTSGHKNALQETLKKINESDLLAVLNEVGRVYTSLHNLTVNQIGSRGNTANGKFEVVFVTDFGFGPRTIVTMLDVPVAEEMIKNFQIEMARLKPSSLITDKGLISG